VKCIYTLITLYEIDVNRSIFDEAMREKMIFYMYPVALTFDFQVLSFVTVGSLVPCFL